MFNPILVSSLKHQLGQDYFKFFDHLIYTIARKNKLKKTHVVKYLNYFICFTFCFNTVISCQFRFQCKNAQHQTIWWKCRTLHRVSWLKYHTQQGHNQEWQNRFNPRRGKVDKQTKSKVQTKYGTNQNEPNITDLISALINFVCIYQPTYQ